MADHNATNGWCDGLVNAVNAVNAQTGHWWMLMEPKRAFPDKNGCDCSKFALNLIGVIFLLILFFLFFLKKRQHENITRFDNKVVWRLKVSCLFQFLMRLVWSEEYAVFNDAPQWCHSVQTRPGVRSYITAGRKVNSLEGCKRFS